MRSVVTARSGTAARAAARRARYRSAVYPRRMATSVASLPDWRGRWRWLQTAGVSAMAAIDLGPEVLGVRAGEPDPADPVDGPHRPEELGEEGAAPGEVPPVGVDVLPEQGDLAHPPAGQGPHLVDQVVEGPARPRRPGPRGRCRRRTSCRTPSGWSPRPRRAGPGRRRWRRPAARPGRGRRRPVARRGPPPPGRTPAPGGAGPGRRARLWVPNTTSTWAARCRIRSRSIWARQPPTAICMPGRRSRSDLRLPRWP